MVIQEAYTPVPLAASGVVFTGQGGIGGFLATNNGFLQLRDGQTSGSPIVVTTMAVVVGVWHAIPFAFQNGLWADLTGGATGTFGRL